MELLLLLPQLGWRNEPGDRQNKIPHRRYGNTGVVGHTCWEGMGVFGVGVGGRRGFLSD